MTEQRTHVRVDHEQVMQLRADGYSQTQIAARVGSTKGSVGMVIRRELELLKRVGTDIPAVPSGWHRIRTIDAGHKPAKAKAPKPYPCAEWFPHRWELDARNLGECTECHQKWQFTPVPWGVA